ncbi:MAG: rod shape-determining protein MreC [Candidatus Daviesbacteria bacterium]|nr:rod shape-determining protein MreC [Candidatus Daviesbacteria bacterium]
MKVLPSDLKTFSFLVFFSLLIFLFDILGFLNFPKTLAQSITVPIQYGLYQGGKTIGNQFEFIVNARTAVKENKALKTQMGELLVENANLKKDMENDQILLSTYNKLNPKTFDLNPARVIGIARFLTIDQGSNNGIVLGQVVVFKDNFVGTVKLVTPKMSQVLLSEDPDSKIAVFSQNDEGRARGILLGQFGSKLLMDKILHEENIKVGDLVYSDGTEGKIPKGLLMGKVTKVLEKSNEIFKQAEVEPIFETQNLDVVFIIKET